MAPSQLRSARVGDLLPSRLLGPARARRLDATALIVPGTGSLTRYLEVLEAKKDDLAAWDGRVLIADADGDQAHRLLVVDRYRQVYEVHDALDPTQLPDADALSEWFRFLATACPECGVIDDPLLTGPTP